MVGEATKFDMKKIASKSLDKLETRWALLIIVIIGLIPLLDLFHQGIPLTHDGPDHIARIASFYQSLSEGILIPRWGGNLNWGFGHPVLMFFYPLPSYLASVVHFLGFSLIDSVKIVFGAAFIASGITMFLWMRNVVGEYGGILAAVLYMYAPYRFVDLYVRGAIGEHVAFVFLPLVLYFLFKLSNGVSNKLANSKEYFYILGTAISTGLLILSHNAMSIMFLTIIVLYILYLSYISKQRFILLIKSLVGIGFGFLLSFFFWFSAFFEGKYTLRDIVTSDEYASRFIEPINLIYSPWSYGITGQFSIQIGFIHIAGVAISIFIFLKLLKKKNKEYIWMAILLLSFFGSIFIMVKESNIIWQTITIFQKFQFPWRFLSLVVFTSSALSGYTLSVIKRKIIKKSLLLLLVIFTVLISSNYWGAKDFFIKADSFFEGTYKGTTNDTGESSPIWSIRFMEKKPAGHIEVIEGKAMIAEKKRSSTNHLYEIQVESGTARIRENTLYFPAWRVYVNGKEVPIEFQDPNSRGLITFNVMEGDNNVLVSFEDTTLRKFANSISIVSMSSILGYGVLIWLVKRKSAS